VAKCFCGTHAVCNIHPTVYLYIPASVIVNHQSRVFLCRMR
jgi:hypothetical protein